MKLTLDIPKELEPLWEKDRFQDILWNLTEYAHLMDETREEEFAEKLVYAFKNAEQAE